MEPQPLITHPDVGPQPPNPAESGPARQIIVKPGEFVVGKGIEFDAQMNARDVSRLARPKTFQTSVMKQPPHELDVYERAA